MAADWDRLLRATLGHTGLQSFDFLLTWWECLGEPRSLWILVFREAGRICGVAPLQIAPRRILGKTYRTVEFLGMTEDILVPRLLFPEPDAPALRAALLEYLGEQCASWDLIELDELASGDPFVGDLEGWARARKLIYRQQAFHDCPFLDLSAETSESFFGGRSRKLLKNVRAAERKLGALGAVSVRSYSAPAEIAEGLAEFARVEECSWKRKESVGSTGDAAYRRFHRRLLEAFASRHAARVMSLRVGDRPVAATLAIVFDGIHCSLEIVHDEQYARFSPGTLLEFHELEVLLREREVRRYEFLGGALANKRRWTTDALATVCVRARTADARMRLLDFYEFGAKPLVKRLLRRAGLYAPDRSKALSAGTT
ncbi:MAG: GNAT family N-acetyltransferase [Gammaproteobacteria bacterium]